MKRRAIALSLLALSAVAGCAPQIEQTAAKNPDDMIAAAKALDQAFLTAFNSANLDALNSVYWDSPEAALFPPGALEARGFAAIKEANRQTLAALPGARMELIESHQMPAGDVVIGWGKWRLTIPDPGGTSTEMYGRHTDIKAERNGKWVYLYDHASAPLPPPPAK